jgi:YVTN family beta-propeller protein
MGEPIRAILLSLLAATACSDDADPAGGEMPDAAGVFADRFYVVNTESASVSVIDHARREVIQEIDIGNKPHGQAPAESGERLYVTTDGGHGEVIAIDTSDNSIEWRLDVGSDLNEPHLTRDDRFLYAPDLLGGRVAVVDVDARKVAAEVAMVDENGANLIALHNTYASHDGRWMYVTAILSQTIARIDPTTNAIERRYALSGDPRPAVITGDDTTMYVQLSALHGFVELDLETGEETAKIEWPEPADPPPGAENETIATKWHGIGITPDGKELWAATNLEGAVYVYTLPDLTEIDRIAVGAWPNWIAFSSDGSTAYVTNTELARERGSVSVVDARSHAVIDTLEVGALPKRIHRVTLPE